MTELKTLLFLRPSFVISCDGRTVTFDEQSIRGHDLEIAVRDFITWMNLGNLRAIGIAGGVHEYELTRFLHALVNFTPQDASATLLEQVSLLNLTNIQLLSRSCQPDLPQNNIPAMAAQTAGGSDAISYPRPSSTNGTNNPDDLRVNTIEGLPSLANPEELDEQSWVKLPAQLEQASARVRRVLISNIAHWLDEAREASPTVIDHVDSLLLERLQQETEHHALYETTVAVERRLETLIATREWPKMIALVDMLYQRLQQESDRERWSLLSLVLDRVGANAVRLGVIDHLIGKPDEQAHIRKMVTILGDHVLHPLIEALKSSNDMQERKRLVRLLIDLGEMPQPLLIEELLRPNPWYVYRNVLHVLAEVGTEAAIGAIAQRMTHTDARVRIEAVTTAVKIAREGAVEYLAQGLEDASPAVCARAAGLISLCPRPRILEIVLRLLQAHTSGGDDVEAIQLAACAGLGSFNYDSARNALTQILRPRLFSPYRGKNAAIRAAAVSALVHHLPHPQAKEAIKQATADKSERVRQLAQRAWEQYERSTHG
jgi:HEAT repeat protein